MTKKNSRDCTERKENDDKKDFNLRRSFRALLQLIDYEYPTDDRPTLREWADSKLKEIEKRNRNREDFNGVSRKIKKRKPSRFSRSLDDSAVTKIMKRMAIATTGLTPDMKNYVKKINGSDQTVEFLFGKKLTKSDVEPGQGRLLMPFLQVHRRDILNQMEKEDPVRLYLPTSQQHYDLRLGQWPTNNPKNYALKFNWNHVVKENGFQTDTVVRLWAFYVGDAPCLLLVPEYGSDHGGASTFYDAGEPSDDDGGIYGIRRSGGVVIREPIIEETSRAREVTESSRSRKGKEKMRKF